VAKFLISCVTVDANSKTTSERQDKIEEDDQTYRE
tara:strand:+ start:887 stop:991 length:105 start_codon:yes stop_codon:yes gene_type:complete